MPERGDSAPCPICGFLYTVPVTRQDRPHRSCPACGLIWGVYPRSSGENKEQYRESRVDDSISLSKLGLYDAVLARVEKELGAPGKLLDVGCGSGAFLLVAKERGWEAVGVEPIAELVQQGKQQGLAMYRGTLKNLPKKAGLFDLIAWWDVFMLVEDPVAELTLALQRLSPRGRMYLRVRQNGVLRQVNRLWGFIGSLSNWKDPSVFHPWNFTPATIRLLGRRAGLEMQVEAGRLSSGDVYRISESGKLVALAKTFVDTCTTTLGRISDQRVILSPTMDVWACRKEK